MSTAAKTTLAGERLEEEGTAGSPSERDDYGIWGSEHRRRAQPGARVAWVVQADYNFCTARQGVLGKSAGEPICAGRRGLWAAPLLNTTSVGFGAE